MVCQARTDILYYFWQKYFNINYMDILFPWLLAKSFLMLKSVFFTLLRWIYIHFFERVALALDPPFLVHPEGPHLEGRRPETSRASGE